MDAKDDVPVAAAKPAASPSDHVGEGEKGDARSTPDGFRSSPPAPTHNGAMDMDALHEPLGGSPEDAGVKSDSEAETIVLPGKDGHSPSKIRKSIKHEDKSDDEELGDAPDIGTGSASGGENVVDDVGNKEDATMDEADIQQSGPNVATSMLGKRKRSTHGNGHGDGNVSSKIDAAPGNSSGLSSVPTSPVTTARSSLSKPGASDSDVSRSPSPRLKSRDKAKSVDRVLPRRKQFASGSGDEGDDDGRRFNRQRSSGADHRHNKDRRPPHKQSAEGSTQKRTRSVSPHSRGHRRSTSTQLLSRYSHGLSHKTKRVPAPLQSTEYQSDESSASGSSHPRSSRLRHLAAPTTGDSTISPPAKIAPHRKHVNSSGQTLLARACGSGKLDVVKQRLEERPEDLDEPDHAMNTPLHAASIAGHDDIVKLLLDSGCIVDPVNLARDTPLHDAIDNGHLECVKALLAAGANPRKANGKGEDPYDLVDDEDDVAAEMKEAINAAKQKTNDVRRPSEDDQLHDNAESRMSYSKGSPRQTPPAHSHDALAMSHTSRRNATTRSIKTSDRELYQPLNLNELRRAAGSNDIRTVVRILDVFNNDVDDPKSLIIAAKAGYDEVINMLFGFSVTNPDPDPLDDMPPESSTPILAAIGRDSLKVIELFLNQPTFNPTRLVNGETYYEIAKKRGGTLWKEEEQLLKDAFIKYNKAHPSSSSKVRSPGLRRDGREATRDSKPPRRDELHSSRSNAKTTGSESSKTQHRSNSSANQSKDGQVAARRGPGRPRKDDNASSTTVHDDDDAPSLGPPKQKNQAKRSEYDAGIASSESETALKPRRKLVSGKEFRGEREMEKQRRTSVASTASGASGKERRDLESNAEKLASKTSPSISRVSKGPSNSEQESTSEKHPERERPRSIKRDDSKDRLTAIRGESPVKRPWKSETPPRSSMQVTTSHEPGGSPQKKRKLEGDTNAKSNSKAERASSSSPDQRMSSTTNDSIHKKPATGSNIDQTYGEISFRPSKRAKPAEQSNASHSSEETSKGQTSTSDSTSTTSKSVGEEASKRDPSDNIPPLAQQTDDEREATARREKEELEAKEKAELESKLELERIEQEKAAREEAIREEELKRQQEENELKERQRQEEIEAHAREQERQRALYLEQEKQRQKDQERRRAQIQEQQRAERARIEEQKNKERLSKLPLLLRWLDGAKDPKTPETAVLFRIIEGFRFDTIKPEATGQPNGREQWMLNTHAAVLLGEKDILLSRYTAWERIPLSPAMKQAVWRIQNGMYSLYDPSLTYLRKQLPEKLPDNGQSAWKVIETSKALFLSLDLFFVKVSEFMFVVPNFPHLRNLEMIVKYRELLVDPTQPTRGKWREDPDTDPNQTFAPQPNHFVNGDFIKQRETPLTKTSTTSFGERKVPRRGLVQVFPGEPDYYTLAREQGLYHLLPPECPTNTEQNGAPVQVNGITPPNSDQSKSINGGSPPQGLLPETNGIAAGH